MKPSRMSHKSLGTIIVLIAVCIKPGQSCKTVNVSFSVQQKVYCCCQWLTEIPSLNDKEHIIELHLDRNRIKLLGNLSFNGYDNVEVINLYSNEIETIETDAFRCLKSLRNLNLSRNKLTILSRYVLSNSPSIKNLNFSHNKFFSLSPEDPFLVSSTLATLDLSYCELEYLPPNTFSELLHLSHVYLNNNNFTSLNRMTFEKLNYLKTVVLRDNPWSCTCDLQETVAVFQERNISLSFPDIVCSLGSEKMGLFSVITENSCRDEVMIDHKDDGSVFTAQPSVAGNSLLKTASTETGLSETTTPNIVDTIVTPGIIPEQEYYNKILAVLAQHENSLKQTMKVLSNDISKIRVHVDKVSKLQTLITFSALVFFVCLVIMLAIVKKPIYSGFRMLKIVARVLLFQNDLPRNQNSSHSI